ncbi:MAG TPA: response regulator transcription factor [Edaphobacter sp.]|nr:response regulator transcription factor [Edaphobacter sp.]
MLTEDVSATSGRLDKMSPEPLSTIPMRVLVVEDEKKVASFVARALREHSHQVDVAETGERGLQMATNTVYELILLDVRLPGITGIQLCRELRQAGVETPVLMLTARSLIEQRVEGLDAGADDYMGKPFALAELHARVRALTRRGLHNRNAHFHIADLDLDRHKRAASRGGVSLSLTSKEFSMLELLMLHSPSVVPRTEIIEYVWSYGFDTETNLVEVYINRLRQKIDQPFALKLIQTVRGVGYSIGPPE